TRQVVQVPGGKAVFPSLSVAEHFRMALWLVPTGGADEVERALDHFPVLRERWDQAAGTLSGGQQQMLGLAMALVTRPRLLLIDELSLGLDPTTVSRLLDVVRAINEQGTAIVVVEQSLDIAASIAHRAYFLEKGQVRFEGPPAELLERPDIARSVFLAPASGAGASRRRRRAADPGPPVLRIEGLRKSFGGIVAVDGVDLELPPDRIVGLIGPNGSGKTTLFDLISGHLTADEGRIEFGGRDVTAWGPHRRSLAGLGRSFQDSRIFGSLPASANLAVGLDRHAQCRDHLASALCLPAACRAEAGTRSQADEIAGLLGLDRYRESPAAELSTGTRHIVDLGMARGHRPSVLLLDEPSSGIAQREAEALGPLLRGVQEELGCAMLVIEHDMSLLASVADEIVALEGGRVIARDTPGRLLRNRRVVRSYLGRTTS
ncbi:MAG TPA: ATP-binding cassette domain-containing protein, partial [Actinomycetota bacterium]|nr:ATP-binding cassette domain-containing protein [Actinomycetota bacterium]